MENKTQKSKKAPGPIRTGAVVPIVIFCLLSFLYFRFLFDHNVKQAVEWTASYIHGAEVNLGSFHSSFLGGSFRFHKLEITDKEQPKQNLLEIGEIHFGFLWDALLRAKLVVNDAAITNIQLYAPRKKPGYVRPPEPPSKAKEGPSEIEKLEKNVLAQTQKDHANNALGDIASLLAGTDEKDVLKNIQGSLKAEGRMKALQEELKVKEKQWKDRLNQLPQKEEFDELAKRAKGLKFDTKNPKQFADDLKEAGRIAKEADAKIDLLKASGKDLKLDLEKYKAEFKQLDDLVEQDIKDIQQRLKIPDMDIGDFSKDMFMKVLAGKLGSFQKYFAVAKKYMPPPKDPNAPKEPELVPPKRGTGKTYRFPITTGYPLFWLKRAAISSEPTQSGFSGKLSGELTNVTTDPGYIKKPAILDVKGDFPHSDIYGVHLKVVVDHIAAPKETVELDIQSFPFNDFNLVDDKELSLLLKSSAGASQLRVEHFQETLNFTVNNQFQKIAFDVQAKSKIVREAVNAILNDIPTVTVNAAAKGSWSDLDIRLNSNLGSELSRGLKKYVHEKIEGIKRQIKDYVDNKIKVDREKLDHEFGKIRSQVDKLLGEKEAELDKAKGELKKSTDKKSNGSDKIKDDLKEKGKKLLKGFKF